MKKKPTYKELEQRVKELEKKTVKSKQVEEKLLKSEKKYHFLFNAINDAVFIIDTEILDILETNQSAVEMYGYSYEEFKSFKITDLSSEPERTSEMIALHKKSVPFRYSKKKDGTYFPIEIKSNYLTFHEKTLNISLVRDFTDRINTAQTLRVNEENLEMAQEVADIGSWDWNIKNDKLFWSDKTFCQFGLKPGEILPTSGEESILKAQTEMPDAVLMDMGAEKAQGLGLAICHSIITRHNGLI